MGGACAFDIHLSPNPYGNWLPAQPMLGTKNVGDHWPRPSVSKSFYFISIFSSTAVLPLDFTPVLPPSRHLSLGWKRAQHAASLGTPGLLPYMLHPSCHTACRFHSVSALYCLPRSTPTPSPFLAQVLCTGHTAVGSRLGCPNLPTQADIYGEDTQLRELNGFILSSPVKG